MKIAREEIFGPVISVIPFDTHEEALRLANATIYGLGGAVWTQNIKTAIKMMHGIKAGQVWINCYGLVETSVGFGGYKHSGYGWKGGSQFVDSFLYQKAVTINGD
jgi:aldehyde dehydrogenase (NAD+)